MLIVFQGSGRNPGRPCLHFLLCTVSVWSPQKASDSRAQPVPTCSSPLRLSSRSRAALARPVCMPSRTQPSEMGLKTKAWGQARAPGLLTGLLKVLRAGLWPVFAELLCPAAI